MRPASGRRSPARSDRTLVLPLPEGPNRAVTGASVAKSRSSRKPEGYASRQRTSSGLTAPPPAVEDFAGGQGGGGEGGGRDDQAPHPPFRGRARLVGQGVDLQRERARLLLVAGEQQGGPELAQPAGERQDGPGQDAVAGQGQGHGEEGVERPGPQRPRRLEQPRVDPLDRQP